MFTFPPATAEISASQTWGVATPADARLFASSKRMSAPFVMTLNVEGCQSAVSCVGTELHRHANVPRCTAVDVGSNGPVGTKRSGR